MVFSPLSSVGRARWEHCTSRLIREHYLGLECGQSLFAVAHALANERLLPGFHARHVRHLVGQHLEMTDNAHRWGDRLLRRGGNGHEADEPNKHPLERQLHSKATMSHFGVPEIVARMVRKTASDEILNGLHGVGQSGDANLIGPIESPRPRLAGPNHRRPGHPGRAGHARQRVRRNHFPSASCPIDGPDGCDGLKSLTKKPNSVHCMCEVRISQVHESRNGQIKN